MNRDFLSSWLSSFENTCPDPALEGYAFLSDPERMPYRTVIWIGVLIAIEQIVHAATLAFSSRKTLTFRLKILPFSLPTALSLLWVVFTALSIVMVGLTFRSNAAVLAKAVHVFIEGLFLAFLASAFGYFVFSGVAAFLIISALTLTLTLPCSETIHIAAGSGLLLDAINFLAYALYGLSFPNDTTLWLLIWGLGSHAMYLITQVGVMRWSALSISSKLWFRISGMFFNLVASEFFLAAVRRTILVAKSGIVNLDDWKTEFESGGETLLPVWTARGLRIIGDLRKDIKTRLFAFEPNRTAYTMGGWKYMRNAILPVSGELFIKVNRFSTRIGYSILCFYKKGKDAQTSELQTIREKTAYVLGWMHIRVIYWFVLIVVGSIVGSFN